MFHEYVHCFELPSRPDQGKFRVRFSCVARRESYWCQCLDIKSKSFVMKINVTQESSWYLFSFRFFSFWVHGIRPSCGTAPPVRHIGSPWRNGKRRKQGARPEKSDEGAVIVCGVLMRFCLRRRGGEKCSNQWDRVGCVMPTRID